MCEDRFSYINKSYNLNIKKGSRVMYGSKPGTVIGARGAHVVIRLDGDKNTGLYHPKWNLTYLGCEHEEGQSES